MSELIWTRDHLPKTPSPYAMRSSTDHQADNLTQENSQTKVSWQLKMLFDTLFIVSLFLNDYRSGWQVEYAVGIRREPRAT